MDFGVLIGVGLLGAGYFLIYYFGYGAIAKA